MHSSQMMSAASCSLYVVSLQHLDNYGPQLSQVGHHAKGNRSSKAMIRHSFRKCHANA
jgi:hypothetical protein